MVPCELKTGFAIAEDSYNFWLHRLREYQVTDLSETVRFGEKVITFWRSTWPRNHHWSAHRQPPRDVEIFFKKQYRFLPEHPSSADFITVRL